MQTMRSQTMSYDETASTADRVHEVDNTLDTIDDRLLELNEQVVAIKYVLAEIARILEAKLK